MGLATRVQVAATAALLVDTSGKAQSGRRSMVIYNSGPNPIAIGADATVTMATGFLIPSQSSMTVDNDPDSSIWAICSVLQVSPADTAIWSEI